MFVLWHLIASADERTQAAAQLSDLLREHKLLSLAGCNRAIQAYFRSGREDEGFKLFEEMRKGNHSLPSTETWDIIVRYLTVTKRHQRAEEMLRLMAQENVPFSSRTRRQQFILMARHGRLFFAL
jgi:pentatricopeptide repeat protein